MSNWTFYHVKSPVTHLYLSHHLKQPDFPPCIHLNDERVLRIVGYPKGFGAIFILRDDDLNGDEVFFRAMQAGIVCCARYFEFLRAVAEVNPHRQFTKLLNFSLPPHQLRVDKMESGADESVYWRNGSCQKRF